MVESVQKANHPTHRNVTNCSTLGWIFAPNMSDKNNATHTSPRAIITVNFLSFINLIFYFVVSSTNNFLCIHYGFDFHKGKWFLVIIPTAIKDFALACFCSGRFISAV